MQRPWFRWPVVDLALVLGLLGVVLLLVAWSCRPIRGGTFAMDAAESITPRIGFHGLEAFPDQSALYRWTTGNSRVQLPNPGGAVVVRLVLAGGPAGTVPVQLRYDAARLHLLVPPPIRTYSLLLPPAPGERINLSLVSPMLSTPERDVGVVVSGLSVFGGRAASVNLLLTALIGVLGGYGLLRWVGWRSWWAASYLSLLLGIALIWRSGEGWTYGLFGVVLAIFAQATLIFVLASSAMSDGSRQRWFALGALVFNSLFYSALYLTMPLRRKVVFREDSFVESLSVLWFCLSAGFSLWFLLGSKRRVPAQFSVIPLLSFICILDETSFGERLFGLTMPEIYTVKIDGIHDLLSIVVVWLKDVQAHRIELGALLALSLAALLLALRYRQAIGAALAGLRAAPPFLFLIIGLGFLVAAQLIDTELYNNELAIWLIEELFEMNGGIGLLFAATSLAQIPSQPPRLLAPQPTIPSLRGSV